MKKKLYLFSILLFIIDVVAKIIVKNNMNLYDSIVIIPNIFNITYVENTGAAFSILMGKQLFLSIIAIIAIVFIIYNLEKEKLNKLRITYYSLIIGGILGNLFDRVFYNKVIDFLDVSILNYQIPIFNLADTFICIGVALVILEAIKGGLNGNKSIR